MVRCGSCKGTGDEHEWNGAGELVATGAKCSSCNGCGSWPRSEVDELRGVFLIAVGFPVAFAALCLASLSVLSWWWGWL